MRSDTEGIAPMRRALLIAYSTYFLLGSSFSIVGDVRRASWCFALWHAVTAVGLLAGLAAACGKRALHLPRRLRLAFVIQGAFYYIVSAINEVSIWVALWPFRVAAVVLYAVSVAPAVVVFVRATSVTRSATGSR